uniref:Vacuolar fusion protein CCZ1 n=1 Tax=Aceria tosichella TaxID=561515 RepID=A0A6G1S9P7_9ACAR
MDLVLKRFMIFNTYDGQGEGCEHEKLLYHWTKDVPDNKIDLTEQIDDICMCDASIGASSRLSTGITNPRDSHDQKKSHGAKSSFRVDPLNQYDTGQSIVITFEPTVVVIVEVEPERSIWMAVHVSPGQAMENDHSQANTSDHNTIPTDAVKQIVRNIYLRFCLLHGTFQMIADDIIRSEGAFKRNAEELKDDIRGKFRTICEYYFNLALAEIHLTSLVSNIASLHNYLVYLDLNPVTLMKVISFINHLVAIDPIQIRHSITIFNDQLIWSSLNSIDSRLLYNYLVAVLIRDALQEELVEETDKVRLIAEDMPIYLDDDCEQLARHSASIEPSMSAVRIDGSKRLTKYYLTVFRSRNNLTLGLIFKDTKQTELKQRCEQMLMTDSRLGIIPLASLAKLVGQNFIKTSANNYSAITNTSSNSVPSKRRQTNSITSSTKTWSLNDHRYLSLDRLSFSVSSLFINADAQNRDAAHHGTLDGVNPDGPSNRKLRFIKYLLELEPEMHDIGKQTDSRVEEYIAKSTSDIWLSVLNSKYRCVYSLYRLKSSILTEARESAINLRSSLVTNRS